MNLREYINTHFGICSLEKCICLNQGWLGMRCEFWKPCDCENYEELSEWQKELKNALNERKPEE